MLERNYLSMTVADDIPICSSVQICFQIVIILVWSEVYKPFCSFLFWRATAWNRTVNITVFI